MNLSNIKKIVLEEGKVVVIDGDDALVIMSFNEYNKNKGTSKCMPESSQVLPEPEPELIPALPEKPMDELTLDDLPF